MCEQIVQTLFSHAQSPFGAPHPVLQSTEKGSEENWMLYPFHYSGQFTHCWHSWKKQSNNRTIWAIYAIPWKEQSKCSLAVLTLRPWDTPVKSYHPKQIYRYLSLWFYLLYKTEKCPKIMIFHDRNIKIEIQDLQTYWNL